MMKYLFGVLGIIIFGFAIQSFMPWWSIVIVCAIVGASIKMQSFQSYFVGFLGVFLLWGFYAFFLNQNNDGILAERMGNLFGGIGPTQLVLLSAFLGGFIGGLGALTGRLGSNLLRQ